MVSVSARVTLTLALLVPVLTLMGCKKAGPDPGGTTQPTAVVESQGQGLDYDACAPYLEGAPPESSGEFMAASEADIAAAQAMTASEQDPRCAHYVFAHRLLPFHVFDDPQVSEVIWLDPNVLDFLEIFANAANEACSEQPQGWQLPLREFNVGRVEVLGRPVVVLDMLPAPVATTEAYLIALVGRPWSSVDERGYWTGLDHYFVLEHSVTREPTHTVFGGWELDGDSLTHLNMGTGPEPTPAAFVHAVGRNLCGDFVTAKTRL